MCIETAAREDRKEGKGRSKVKLGVCPGRQRQNSTDETVICMQGGVKSTCLHVVGHG
jgi:hypothetical protein